MSEERGEDRQHAKRLGRRVGRTAMVAGGSKSQKAAAGCKGGKKSS